MQNKAINIINEVKKIFEETYSDFKGIYFFGSQSKNINPIESDFDLALIFSRKIKRKFKNEIIDLIYGFDLKYEVVLDVKIFSESDIKNPITSFRKKTKDCFMGHKNKAASIFLKIKKLSNL